MRVDPHVTRPKFGREVRRLIEQESVLQEMGIWPQRAHFPYIDLVFLRKTAPILDLTVQHQGQGVRLAAPLVGLVMFPFGVRLGLDDFDMLPPKVSFHDPWAWGELPAALIPPGQSTPQGGEGTGLIVHGHPKGGHSFLCLPGTRDYHSHPQHSEEEWFRMRGTFTVFELVQQIWRFFVLNPRPIASMGVALPDTQPAHPETAES